jgi:hypothetical protein
MLYINMANTLKVQKLNAADIVSAADIAILIYYFGSAEGHEYPVL